MNADSHFNFLVLFFLYQFENIFSKHGKNAFAEQIQKSAGSILRIDWSRETQHAIRLRIQSSFQDKQSKRNHRRSIPLSRCGHALH